jgi:hypothetical protein
MTINATVGNGDCHWETDTKTDTPAFGDVMIR